MAKAKTTAAKIKAVEKEIEKHKKIKADKAKVATEKKALEQKKKQLATIKGTK